MKKYNSFKIPRNREPGVYAIINTTKGKCYIGETEDKEYRCRCHLSLLKNGKHTSQSMQKDFDAGNIFKVEYLCDTSKHKTDERKILEAYYYCCLKSRGAKLYNSTKIHYADNYFIRCSFSDERIRNLIKIINT